MNNILTYSTFSKNTSLKGILNQLNFLTLELTTTCNLKCLHCYSDSTSQIPIKGEMNLQDWKKVILESFEVGCRNVQFIGGEVTIHPDLSELIYYADSLGYLFIEVYTNGTNLNSKLKEVLIDTNVNLAFSIYSDQPIIHDSITKHNGSFQKSVESINWAIKAGLKIRVGVVEMKANEGMIEQTISFLSELGVVNIEVDQVRGIGRGKNDHDSETRLDELCGKCTNGGICVTSTGQAYPCVFSRFWPLGNIKEGVKNIYNGTPFNEFRRELELKMKQQKVEERIELIDEAECLLHYS